MSNKFDIFADQTIQELKDTLGWWVHSENENFVELISVCMILCDKIADLEQELKSTKEMARRKTCQ